MHKFGVKVLFSFVLLILIFIYLIKLSTIFLLFYQKSINMSTQINTQLNPYNQESGSPELKNSQSNDNYFNSQTLGGSINAGTQQASMGLELYERLLKTGVYKASPNIQVDTAAKRITLDQESSQLFFNGMAMSSYMLVFKQVLKSNNQDLNFDSSKLEQLKNQQNAQTRLFNWNLIIDELDSIGIQVESDSKAIIIAGDQESIEGIYYRLEKYMQRIADEDILSFKSFKKVDDRLTMSGINNIGTNPNSVGQSKRGSQAPTQKRKVKDGVDILQMSHEKDPEETESTLELILNTLSKAFGMKPKQAAALLTNNNQYLVHSCVKGVKSRYEPVIEWYKSLYNYSKLLSSMMDSELEQYPQMQQNFIKVLITLSTGLYSHNQDVCEWTLKLISRLAEDFRPSQQTDKLSQDWFFMKDGGLQQCHQVYKRHKSLIEQIVCLTKEYCIGDSNAENLKKIYIEEFQKAYETQALYINTMNDYLYFINIHLNKQLIEQNIIPSWIEICSRSAEKDGKEDTQERISAITLLSELWIYFTQQINSVPEIVNTIQFILKRACRERFRPIRLIAICSMFQILNKFAKEKINYAPGIYKTLTFSLVENPSDVIVREIYFSNFTSLFQQFANVPIGQLIEPLMRQIQQSDALTQYQWKIFDFDFYSFISQHPKLTVNNALQVMDALVKIFLTDVCYASSASIPFIQLSSRFQNDGTAQDFLNKFISVLISLLQNLEKAVDTQSSQPDSRASLNNGQPIALQNHAHNAQNTQGSGVRITKKKGGNAKDDRLRRQKDQEEDVNRRLKKAHIVQVLLKIQNLRNESINEAMRQKLMVNQRAFKERYGYVNNGIMALLKYYGDPDKMFMEYQDVEDKKQKEIDDEKRKAQGENQLVPLDSNGQQLQPYVESDDNQNGDRLSQLGNDKDNDNSQAMVPYSGERTTKQIVSSKYNSQQSAIEQIQIYKQKREQHKKEKALEEERRREHQEKSKKALQQQLAKRKIALGVGDSQKDLKLKDLIIDPESQHHLPSSSYAGKEIELYEIELEEERDQEALRQLMKNYGKLWKFLFTKYNATVYNPRGRGNFDKFHEQGSQIRIAEIIKLLKDQDHYPKLINKEELTQICKLINQKIYKKSDLRAFDYTGFLFAIIQICMFSFTRNPYNKSHLPPADILQFMIEQWTKATRARGQSTILYEDIDVTDIGDKELITALNSKLAEDPSYPIPEGYFKQKEKIIKNEYKVPESMATVIGESKTICIEVIDELLHKAFGFHFIEPIATFEEKYKVKPQVRGVIKPKAEALNYMKKVEKKLEPIQKKQNDNAFKDAHQKRQDHLEVKPKLNITLKIEVAKKPLKERPFTNEVAEVLEEILQAAEKGLTTLPARLNRAPGQVENDAKRDKLEEEKKLKEQRTLKENARKARDKQIKEKLKVMQQENEEKKKKLQEEAQDKKKKEQELARKKTQAYRAEQEKRRKEIEEKKEKDQAARKERQDAENEKKQEQDKQKKQERAEFLKKQKTKLVQDFKNEKEDRENLIKKQETIAKKKVEAKDSLKKQMEEFIKENKGDREKVKQERDSIKQFLESDEVTEIFDAYDQGLIYMYQFYAAQDGLEIGQDENFLKNTINFKEFIMFGYQQNITPTFFSPELMTQIFKELVRQRIEDLKGSELNEDIQTDLEGDQNSATVLDYYYFKISLIRIAIIAQEKLGGQNQDVLIKKMEEEGKKNDEAQKKKQKLKQKQTEKEAAQKEVIDELRKEYDETQKKNDADKDSKQTFMKQKLNEKLEVDDIKKFNEEQFFQKWLKQQEEKGIIKEKTDKKLAKDKESEIDRDQYQSTLSAKKTNKELTKLEKEIKDAAQVEKIKIDKRQIRQTYDVSTISSQTIEGMLQYLGLERDFQQTSVKDSLILKKDKTLTQKDLSQYQSQDRLNNNSQLSIKEDEKTLNPTGSQITLGSKKQSVASLKKDQSQAKLTEKPSTTNILGKSESQVTIQDDTKQEENKTQEVNQSQDIKETEPLVTEIEDDKK